MTKDDPDRIVDAIVAEWEAAGRPMPEWGDWAFGRSHVYNRKIGAI